MANKEERFKRVQFLFETGQIKHLSSNDMNGPFAEAIKKQVEELGGRYERSFFFADVSFGEDSVDWNNRRKQDRPLRIKDLQRIQADLTYPPTNRKSTDIEMYDTVVDGKTVWEVK